MVLNALNLADYYVIDSFWRDGLLVKSSFDQSEHFND